MHLPTSVNINGEEWSIRLSNKNGIVSFDDQGILYIDESSTLEEQKKQLLKYIIFNTYMDIAHIEISSDEVNILNSLSLNIFDVIHSLGFLNPDVDFVLLSAKKWGE